MYFLITFLSLLTISSCEFDFCWNFPKLHRPGLCKNAIAEIIKYHNLYRRLVANGECPNQPKASNMLKMEWDDRLARQAQYIADTCKYGHVEVTDDRFEVGQNLYAVKSTNIIRHFSCNFTRAITAWYDEHPAYRFNNNTYNHYTQVVWATTNKVGCGHRICCDPDTKRYQEIFVCNYGPAGNWVGEYPYKVGDGCEELCKPE